MTENSGSAPETSNNDQGIKGLVIKGIIGAVSLAGTTAIPLVIQQHLTPNPAASPAAQVSPAPNASPAAQVSPVQVASPAQMTPASVVPNASPAAEGVPAQVSPIVTQSPTDQTTLQPAVIGEEQQTKRRKRKKDDDD